MSLKNLNVRFSVSDGRISFLSSGGKEIVGEEASLIESSSVQGEKRMFLRRLFILRLMSVLRVRTVSGWLFECAWFNQKTDPG